MAELVIRWTIVMTFSVVAPEHTPPQPEDFDHLILQSALDDGIETASASEIEIFEEGS